MEHYRPNGKLAQGYFCANCGQPAAMLGHAYGQTEMNFTCIRNAKLVGQVEAANRYGQKPHYIYQPED